MHKLTSINSAAKPIKIELEYNLIHYICPKCKQIIKFRKKVHGTSLCMQCGQRLDWEPANSISVEIIQAEDSDEAAWIAKEYYRATGLKEEEYINIDDFRQSLRGNGAELYLLFMNPKAKGRFMRSYAKEGLIHDG